MSPDPAVLGIDTARRKFATVAGAAHSQRQVTVVTWHGIPFALVVPLDVTQDELSAAAEAARTQVTEV